MVTVRSASLSGLFPTTSGSYLSANLGYEGPQGNSSRSISMWIKVPTVSGIPPQSMNGTLLYWGQNTLHTQLDGRCWSIELRQGKPRLWVRGAHMTVSRAEGDRGAVDDGEWHLMTFQFQDGLTIDDVEIWVDDVGPLDTTLHGSGVAINTYNVGDPSPFTIGARLNTQSPTYRPKRTYYLEQVAIWTEPLTPGDITFIWNKGKNGGGGLTVTGTNGEPNKNIDPSALSGTINLDAWYSFDSPKEFTTELYNVAPPGARSLAAFNGATWIYDSPASGTFPL